MTAADPATVAQLVFDHRASIVGYLNDQANAFEVSDQKEVSAVLRAQASNIAIQCDIRAGRRGIASPVDAIILEVCAVFGGTNHAEIMAPQGNDNTKRVRVACLWVAKKKLRDWADEQIAGGFHRDRSTVAQGIKRAEELRANDVTFRRITDNLIEQHIRCENCQHELLPASQGGN